MSPNNFFFKKMHGGILQEVSWWALEKRRIKQYIKGGLSSGQFVICVFVSVLNKGDCVSGVWDTYICKHAHYKWKSRERRHCLIHQDMNFFLVLTATAITLDHPRKPLPQKTNHGTGSPTVEPILSLVWDGWWTEIILFKSFVDSVPNILTFNIKFAFKSYFTKNKR